MPEIDPGIVYFAALMLALPAAPFALALLLIHHATLTRNPFRILFDLLTAFVWGAPIAIAVFIALITCTFFPAVRAWAAIVLLLFDLLVAGIILRSIARKSPRELLILVPTLLSFLFSIYVMRALF